MPFIAAPVAIWVAGAATAVGVTAATAATVGALAGAIAVGVVSGAVIGAAGAAITGGNILEGALKGAVIGGVSAGVFSGLGMATGFASTGQQLGAMGVNQTATGMLDVGASLGAGATTGAVEAGTGALEATGAGAVEAGTGAIATPAAERTLASKIFLDSSGSLSDTSGRVIASGIEGAAKAMLTEAPDDAPVESQSEYLAQVQAMNASGDFQKRVANIKVPTHWQNYTKIPPTPVNPSIAPSIATPQGGSYAPA
jgi:hypothetical protein